MAKPRKFPSDIYKYFIITKIVKECDLESQDRLLSVVSDPHLEAKRNQTTNRQLPGVWKERLVMKFL